MAAGNSPPLIGRLGQRNTSTTAVTPTRCAHLPYPRRASARVPFWPVPISLIREPRRRYQPMAPPTVLCGPWSVSTTPIISPDSSLRCCTRLTPRICRSSTTPARQLQDAIPRVHRSSSKFPWLPTVRSTSEPRRNLMSTACVLAHKNNRTCIDLDFDRQSSASPWKVFSGRMPAIARGELICAFGYLI